MISPEKAEEKIALSYAEEDMRVWMPERIDDVLK